jgi:hypothetical protein
MRSTMTKAIPGLALLAVALAGCNHSPVIRDHKGPPGQPQGKADVASLVNYMNLNAKRVQSVRAKVAIDAKLVDAKRGTQAIGLDGLMACRAPSELRLRASALGQPAVDLGSNKKELWYWLGKADPPYVYHCSHDSVSSGKARLPFPFQPDMVLAAMNMAVYPAADKGKYTLKEGTYSATKGRGTAQYNTLELTQEVTSQAGQTYKRTTIFNRTAVKAPESQVLAHVLADAKGNLICRAVVTQVTVDRDTSAVIPTKVTIEWPAQKASMDLALTNVEVNVIGDELATRLFSRDDLSKYDAYDLAKGLVTPTAGIRRASGTAPIKQR